MRAIHVALLVLGTAASCFSEWKNVDVYASYTPELFIRLGVNYKWVGGYVRPGYSKNDKGNPYFTSVDRIGAEAGVNLNRKLFETKYIDFIANVSGGFALQHVRMNVNHNSLWEKSIVLAFMPEIRFMKKVSLIVSPCYTYYLPEKEMNFVATTAWKMPSISVLNTSFGIKLYW